MNEKTVELRRQRELGEILSDTFLFVKQNYRELFKVLVKNVGPAFLLLFGTTAYYNYAVLGSINNGDIFDITDAGGTSYIFIAGGAWLVGILVYYGFLYSTLLNFMKFYVYDRQNIDYEGISKGSFKDFWGMIGLLIMAGIILGLSFIICFFPVIYTMVPMTLVFAIYIFERRDVFDSIGYSFSIIKDNYWITLATIIVFAILVTIMSFIFQLPVTFYSMIEGFFSAEEVTYYDYSQGTDWFFITLSVFSNMLQYLLHGFTVIMAAFIYFNLNERHNFTGTLETIDTIGQRNDETL